MWTPVTWYMLLSVCSADPAVGCAQTVMPGFMSQQACEAAATGPLSEALAHVAPSGAQVTLEITCVGIETREA